MEKNSSGSFSRVSFLRSGSIPRPSFSVVGVDGAGWRVVGRDDFMGVKAVAVVRKRRVRRVRIMVAVFLCVDFLCESVGVDFLL